MSVQELIFGDAEARAEVERFCERVLDAGVAEVLFEAVSVGVTLGVRLEDGRRVVVKAHQPREGRERLAAMVRVQRAHHEAGFPCPRPLAEPAPLGQGFGTVEELLDAGELRDGRHPSVRRAMAELLAVHLELAARCGPEPALAGGWSLFGGGGLWPPEPHSPIFDFDASAAGAGWIDALAAEAKPAALAPVREVVGHTDWSAEHFRFVEEAGRLRATAVYDWDSLALRAEPHVLGVAAATFTMNPDLGVEVAPSPAESRAFLDEHSAARQRPLTEAERAATHAAVAYVVAYIARCEHALGAEGPFTRALRRHGGAYAGAGGPLG